MIRKTLTAGVATLAFLLLPAPAPATFHLMTIVEVFPGTATDPTAQYIMLQMYAPGQNFVAGQPVAIFDANGVPLGTFTFQSDVANGADRSTILISTPDAETLFGIAADLTMMPVIEPAGGAVCYSEGIDCVAWGSFSNPTALPTPPDTVFNAPTGLTPGMAIHRDITDPFGDVTSFALAPPAPENNAGQTAKLACAADCNGDGQVSVNEIVTMVDIALGSAPLSECEPGDANHDGQITINEILTAVDNALNGCPS
jgi:hypothetical protein